MLPLAAVLSKVKVPTLVILVCNGVVINPDRFVAVKFALALTLPVLSTLNTLTPLTDKSTNNEDALLAVSVIVCFNPVKVTLLLFHF